VLIGARRGKRRKISAGRAHDRNIVVQLALLAGFNASEMIAAVLLFLLRCRDLVFNQNADPFVFDKDPQKQVAFAICVRKTMPSACCFDAFQSHLVTKPADERVRHMEFFHEQKVHVAFCYAGEIAPEISICFHPDPLSDGWTGNLAMPARDAHVCAGDGDGRVVDRQWWKYGLGMAYNGDRNTGQTGSDPKKSYTECTQPLSMANCIRKSTRWPGRNSFM
jgi:hypothetical protein